MKMQDMKKIYIYIKYELNFLMCIYLEKKITAFRFMDSVSFDCLFCLFSVLQVIMFRTIKTLKTKALLRTDSFLQLPVLAPYL